MSNLEKVRDYFYLYEGIGTDSIIYGDYVPENAVNYSIVQSPSNQGGKVRKYIQSGGVKEFNFAFMVKQVYSMRNDADKINFQNSKFFQDLEEWIEDNNTNGIYPEIDGAFKVEVLSTGFLFDVDDSGQIALYQMTARVLYTH